MDTLKDTPIPKARQRWGALTVMLSASLVMHALLSPLPLLLGLGALMPLLAPPDEPAPPEEALNAIPIDLVDVPADEPAPRQEDAAPLEASAPPQPEAAPEAPAPQVEPDPVPPAPQPEEPEPAPVEPPVVPAGPFADPVALSGAAGELADSNAHVRVLIDNGVIRQHPLGRQVGALLARTPQWRDFFGPTGVDPVRDVDRVLIAGPQLRDSSNVVAVVEHRLADAAIQAALTHLVERDGRWLRREPPLALARADRAERVFAAPRSGIVAVAPPSAEKSVRQLGPKLNFGPRAPGVAVQAFIDRPSRPARALGLRIPDSFEWLRAEVLPLPDGGVRVKLLMQDGSAEEARKHARELQKSLRAAVDSVLGGLPLLGGLNQLLGGTAHKPVERIDFFAEKDQVQGLIEMTGPQLKTVTDLLDAFLPAAPRAASESGARSAPTGAGESSASGDSTEGVPEPDGTQDASASGGSQADTPGSAAASGGARGRIEGGGGTEGSGGQASAVSPPTGANEAATGGGASNPAAD